MPLQINDVAPNFTAETTEGPIDFYQWAVATAGWCCFPIPRTSPRSAPTELGAVAKLKPEFDKRGVKVIGLFGRSGGQPRLAGRRTSPRRKAPPRTIR